MGLDNIWIEPKGQSLPLPTFDPPLALAVGYFTDPANSFRGKCYADLVQAATGASLYDDFSNRAVRRTTARLEASVPVITDLARMFRAFGDAGYDLKAWF